MLMTPSFIIPHTPWHFVHDLVFRFKSGGRTRLQQIQFLSSFFFVPFFTCIFLSFPFLLHVQDLRVIDSLLYMFLFGKSEQTKKVITQPNYYALYFNVFWRIHYKGLPYITVILIHNTLYYILNQYQYITC